ncbi:MAG: CHC2 zinc finger domain-containing protein [Candidatus Moranbacteria bacterium]|nr:CHC2 zinc finger domain-containing protein [Candidatus Moranbacteria bacterium]
MNSDVEEVKSRVNIVELIGEYIRLTKAGSNWKALCPFHNEKSPSFIASEERRSWHCFGCGKGGDAFSFVMEMEGIGFREALEQLAQKAGVQLKKYEGTKKKEDSVKPKLYKILELAAKWYEKNLWEGTGKEKILKYLRERGLTDETMRKFRLGYAPEGWRNILEFLLKKNYNIADISKTGLLVEKSVNSGQRTVNNKIGKDLNNNTGHWSLTADRCYDRFRDRIMFPILDVMGRVVGFSARVAPGGDEKNAKYINTPQSELYDKSKTLYGLHLAKTEIRKKDEIILVEGNMDVIASSQAGFPNTVAVSGTALTFEQIKIIKRYTENLKMAFDMDSAGQAAAKKSARVCLENDLDVRIVLLPSGKDAADIIRENKEIWRKSVLEARGLIEYYFEDIFSRHDSKDPLGKKKIAKELLNVIKDISSPVEQSHWLKVLAEKLGTEEKILANVLEQSKKETRETKTGSREVEKKQEKKGYSHEKRIIGLLLAFPKEGRRQLEKIRPDYFFEKEEKSILEAIKKEKGDYDPAKIKSSFSDYKLVKFIEETILEAEVEAENRTEGQRFFDPALELKACLERLKKTRIKEKIVRITQDIKEAERTGDKEAVKILVNEFQNLASGIEI